jgi:hypothetical protein
MYLVPFKFSGVPKLYKTRYSCSVCNSLVLTKDLKIDLEAIASPTCICDKCLDEYIEKNTQ